MANQGYFTRSGHGFFTRSEHGFRGAGVEIGTWFYALLSGSIKLQKSADGITFADALDPSSTIGLPPATMLGTRLFGTGSYLDSPYASPATTYSGGIASIATNIIEAGSALIACSRNVAQTGLRVIRSTDGGATWATITHPNPTVSGSFVGVLTAPIMTNTGRVIVLARSNSSNLLYPIYSDDDGATWTGGAKLSTPTGGTTILVFFCRANGTVVLCRGDTTTWESSDDGATYAAALTGLTTGFTTTSSEGAYQVKFGADILTFVPKGVAGPHLRVIRNDGASASDYTTVIDRGVGFWGPDDVAYTVFTGGSGDNKLYSSPISDLVTWTLIVTSPTTLVITTSGPTRLVAENMRG